MMNDPEQLFEGWFSGDLTEEEMDKLLERLNEGQEDNPWPTLIERLLLDPGISGMGGPEQRERLFQQLMERGRRESPMEPIHGSAPDSDTRKKKAVIRIFRWVAAASLILLVISGYWWYRSSGDHPVKAPGIALAAASDLLPGGNKATLTLGNGSTILLDSATKGPLAEQPGAVVVKMDNGQIVYQQKNSGSVPSSPPADQPAPVPNLNTLTTPKGGQYKLILPDGTLVWLNAASSITYPTAFTGKERKVRISGEAYFEVAKNNAMPFRVQVKEMEVMVLGTHFDIRAYEDEAAIHTSLLEGAVLVSQGNNRARLQPGNQAQLNADGAIKVLPVIDMDAVMAWKNGYFSFHHADLQTVMRELARWYDVDIEYRGKVPDMKFGGDISRNANASQVLHILEESKIHFIIAGKKIIVTP